MSDAGLDLWGGCGNLRCAGAGHCRNQRHDLEADITKALENNYSLKILEKQIGHAVSTSNRESLEQSYKNQKEVAANSVKTAYQDLLLAKEDYVQAQQSHE